MAAGDRLADASLTALMLCGLLGGAAGAADEEPPALEFLEYLGSWEESDEDWLLINELDGKPLEAEEKRRSDPEPKDEESTESEHES